MTVSSYADEVRAREIAEARDIRDIDDAELMDGWQPIDSAPENTPVLVWHPGFGMGGWNVMRRYGGEWMETAHDGRTLKDGYDPTYWMPLPPPPTEPSK